VRLFPLVPAYARREVALQKEGLAQPPASIQEKHLPTGPMALPSAIQGRKFERPIIKRVRFDGCAGHGLEMPFLLFFDYELSLYKLSTYNKPLFNTQWEAEGPIADCSKCLP
jgi:hypothetical protein